VLKHRRTNMDVPISIGVVLTTALSLHETFVRGPHAYFDGVVMLLFFLLTGRWLDSVMRDRARDGVTALLKHKAAGALVLSSDGTSNWVAADALRTDMVMLLAAGERLAADGVITKGRSHFDLALLTGESAPVTANEGDAVHAGTLNIDMPVEIRITAAGASTVLADIARMMEDAGQSKSRYVRIADRAARWYAPAVHLLALLSFVGWMLAGAGWHQSLLIAVAVLIITCPCALGLAVPRQRLLPCAWRGAAALGASILEKHFTSDRSWPGPDIPISIDPTELRDLITGSAAIHQASGGRKRILPGEAPTIAFAYACVVTTRPIAAGEVLDRSNVWVKRPGSGEILAKHFPRVLGTRAAAPLPADTQLRWADFAEAV
jgi:Cu2+-exporting ATPase